MGRVLGATSVFLRGLLADDFGIERSLQSGASHFEVSFDVAGPVVDIVGTGGDRSHSVNISTMAALVAVMGMLDSFGRSIDRGSEEIAKGDPDRVLVVDAKETTQIARLLERDQIDRGLAESMLANQASRLERLSLANDVISNEGTLDALAARVAQDPVASAAVTRGRDRS